MFKQSLLALTVAAAGFAATGISAAHANDLSYTYVQGSYSQTELEAEGASLDLDGLNLTGSFAITDQFFVTLDAGRTEGDERIMGFQVDAEVDSKTAMIGFHTALNDDVDFVASVGRTWADVTIDIEDAGEFEGDGDANLLSVGLRGMASESLELFANAVYVDGDEESDTNLNLGGMFHVASNVGIGLSYTSADDADVTGIFARVSF